MNKYEKRVCFLVVILPLLIFKYFNLDITKQEIQYIKRSLLKSPEHRSSGKGSKQNHDIRLDVHSDKMHYLIEHSSYCALKNVNDILSLPKDSSIEIGIRGVFMLDGNLINYPQKRDQIIELNYKSQKIISLTDVNRCRKKDFIFLFYGWSIFFIYNLYKVYKQRKSKN